MTIFISIAGLVARFAGDVLTTTLGWASSLMFGRVPRSHQIFLVLMLAGSLLWIFLIVGFLAPGIPGFVYDISPHPFVDRSWLSIAIIVGIVIVPLGVGPAGYLVPADGERPAGLAIVRELLRGYLLTPVLSAMLLFLPAVGISRKTRSLSRGWSDTHIPIVVKPKGYDQIVTDLADALDSANLPVGAEDAPTVLSLPALLISKVAGGNVRKLRPDRLVELEGHDLRIGIYPSDIAISGPTHERTRARAAILSRLATSAAHLTTSAEAQAVEDRIERLVKRQSPDAGSSPAVGPSSAAVAEAFAPIDATLLDLEVPSDEWDILYRLRLQAERDLLAGAYPGMTFPGSSSAPAKAAPPKRPTVALDTREKVAS
jgi:hypothetical protein